MPKTAPAWRPDAAREICALADMPHNAARGFTLYGGDNDEKLEDCHMAARRRAWGLSINARIWGCRWKLFPTVF